MHNEPRVSVLLPVYNAEAYLAEALESVLTQPWQHLEVVAVDDGSTDGSAAILQQFARRDPRVRVISQENHGCAHALNRAMAEATGVYWARLDADDVQLPARFPMLVEFMERHPDVGVMGSGMVFFGAQTTPWQPPYLDHAHIYASLLFGNSSLAHPTVVFRGEVMRAQGFQYDPAFRNAEDYELWARAGQQVRFANVPDILCRYRVHGASTTQALQRSQHSVAGRVRRGLLARLGVSPTPAQWQLHEMLADQYGGRITGITVREVEGWFAELLTANTVAQVFCPEALKDVMRDCWQQAICSRRWQAPRPAWYLAGGASSRICRLHGWQARAKYLALVLWPPERVG